MLDDSIVFNVSILSSLLQYSDFLWAVNQMVSDFPSRTTI